MSELDTELRALAAGVDRPGVNEAAAASTAEARRSFGRLGALAGWWANVHPSGLPESAAVAWAGPGWDDIAVPHRVQVHAVAAPSEAPGDALARFRVGVEASDALVDAGADVVLVHVDAVPAARRLVCTMLTLDATEAFGFPRSAGGVVVPDDATWVASVARLRDELRALRPHAGRPAEVLQAIDEPLLVHGTALIVNLAARRTPMLLAGLGALACASIVRRVAPAAFAWWQIADTADDPLHEKLVANANLTPVLAHGTGPDGLLGGRVALGVLETAAGLITPR